LGGPGGGGAAVGFEGKKRFWERISNFPLFFFFSFFLPLPRLFGFVLLKEEGG